MASGAVSHSRSTNDSDGPGSQEDVVSATFKVLVLGNSDVGKSTLIRVYTTGRAANNLLPTVGIDFTDVIVSVGGTKVKLRIWDTAGQERFFTFTKQFFRGTQGILLVYDITSLESFQTLMKWLQTIKEMGLEHISIVVVGNKEDRSEEREVPRKNAEKLAGKHGHQYIETSAATGRNVKKAFYELAESLIYSHGIFQPGHEAALGSTSFNGDTSDNCHVHIENSLAGVSFILRDDPIAASKEKRSSCCKT